jgi:1,4-alpha-glucan branching enzyme
VGNQGGVHAEALSWMGRPYSIPINLPPLGGLVLVHEAMPAPEQVADEDDGAAEETLDADAE